MDHAQHARSIDKDTTLCISLAARPSNFGTRFHNYLYNALELNYVYKAFTTSDLRAAIGGVRGLGIRGCAISMPFKEDVIELVDVMHDSAAAIDSVNTVVNDAGELHAYNTDYQAVANLLRDNAVPTELSFALAGSGGMAKAVVAAVRDAGFTDGTVVARNEAAGRALADKYGFRYAPTLDHAPGFLLNATPVGMDGDAADAMPFTEDAVRAATTVLDVVAKPPTTPLIRLATQLNKSVITGADVIALQAAEQFVLYTGVHPTPEQISRASEYASAG